jgi:LCP family protein required for cell wall assembly
VPERPGDRDDDSFDWLYGEQRPPAGADPEPTRLLPLGGSRQDSPPTQYQPPYEPRAQPPYASGQRMADQAPYGAPAGAPGQPAYAAPPPGAPSQRLRSPSRKPRRRWPRVLLVLLVLWVAFLVAVPIWAWSKIDKVNATPAGDRPPDTPGTTYLLVGSDSRAGLSPAERARLATGDAAGQRTDTILLLHVPDGSAPTLLLSIPRDSYVTVPGHSKDKINAAFSYGGPRLLVRTVENATGLRVDDYIQIGFGGFVNIVDAVGGVQICPKVAMQDPKANLDIAKGCQQADGATALGYVRSRYTDPLGDIGRAARQREVVSAVAEKAASPLTTLLPWRYVSLASSGASAVRIGDDVGPLELGKFAWAVAHVGGNGLTCTVPIANPGAIINNISYVLWNRPAAKKMFAAIAADRTDTIDCNRTGTS